MKATGSDHADHESPDGRLTRLLRQLTLESDRFTEMFAEVHRLHRTDLTALNAIMDADGAGHPLSPSRLAEALHLSASATTAVLDRLESSGHVERARSTRDRRVVTLHMPEKARRLGRQLFLPLAAAYAESWRDFDATEREVIERFLTSSIEATVKVQRRLAAG